ncbi:VanZ family protein [Haloarchaeobius sp. TZWWS8]|uniref:VanZ family protein n=1 Tax=Haloarchaeobius sp. TZWWS8 TaxID=3446121 RepID=UPI003EBFFC97
MTRESRGRSLLAGTMAMAILAASVVTPPGDATAGVGPFGLLGVDKWYHLLGYAGLGGVVAWAARPRTWQRAAAVVALVAGFGAGIELVQYTIPARAFDPTDGVVNAVGAMLGTGLWTVYARVASSRST